MEHINQWIRVAAAHESKIAPGNVESCNVASPFNSQEPLFERSKRATDLTRVTPESPCRMYEVDMGAVDTGRFETMKEITRLEHRSIERLAVERHQRPGAAQIVGDDIEHGALA